MNLKKIGLEGKNKLILDIYSNSFKVMVIIMNLFAGQWIVLFNSIIPGLLNRLNQGFYLPAKAIVS